MTRINETAFKQYRDGQDRLTALEYTRERELIRLAINDLEDRLATLEERSNTTDVSTETPTS